MFLSANVVCDLMALPVASVAASGSGKTPKAQSACALQ